MTHPWKMYEKCSFAFELINFICPWNDCLFYRKYLINQCRICILYLVFHVVMYCYMIDFPCNGRGTVSFSNQSFKKAFLEITVIHKRRKYRVTHPIPTPPKNILHKNWATRERWKCIFNVCKIIKWNISTRISRYLRHITTYWWNIRTHISRYLRHITTYW